MVWQYAIDGSRVAIRFDSGRVTGIFNAKIPSGPKLVKVSGTVRFKDGSLIPVEERGKMGSINFAPVGEAVAGQVRKGAGGTLDENGHFDLFTFKLGTARFRASMP